MFQASPSAMEIEKLVDDLSVGASTPTDLRCGEYAFEVAVNPSQHPIFDNHLPHLFALLPSLCVSCGGLVYLMGDDKHFVKHETFERFKERLKALIAKKCGSYSVCINVIPVSFQLRTQRAWAAILAKKSYDTNTLNFLPLEIKGIGKPMGFDVDMFGQIHTKGVYDTQSHENKAIAIDKLLGAAVREIKNPTLHTNDQENATLPMEREESNGSNPSVVTEDISRDKIPYNRVDFSSCQRLNWSEHAQDWRGYIKVKEVKGDDAFVSCPMWKPTQPMRITPSRECLRYLFESEKDMDAILSAVTTGGPGFAIVCKTWRFHLSHEWTEERPTAHICDILTVTDTGKVSLWVVVSSYDDDDGSFESQMKHLMTTARMLKYQIFQKETGEGLSNLWIDCHLLPVTTPPSIGNSIKLRLHESQEIQEHLQLHLRDQPLNFGSLQRALGKLILSKESPLKRCVDDHTTVELSAQQAEVLMHKAKVNYVSGPAGSGKSWTAVCLYRMYGKERSVYICTTRQFLEYLKFNECTGTLVKSDQDLLNEIQRGTFSDKICVIIDDCHNFTCTSKSMKELFQLLKRNRDMSLFVFADNEYQAFDRRRQQAIHDCILSFTRKLFKEEPLNFRLTDIYRNTRKVVSFVQAAIQDIYCGYQNIESANSENGDGVECIRVENLWWNNAENELVVYLRSLQASEKYTASEVAVLLDVSYTLEQIEQCKKIVEEHVPNIVVQGSDVFPRTGVIVDSVDSFLGLDSRVCVFVLPNAPKRSSHPLKNFLDRGSREQSMNMYNPRYEVFLASRATHKAVFVVPEMHGDLVQQMKFDLQVCTR